MPTDYKITLSEYTYDSGRADEGRVLSAEQRANARSIATQIEEETAPVPPPDDEAPANFIERLFEDFDPPGDGSLADNALNVTGPGLAFNFIFGDEEGSEEGSEDGESGGSPLNEAARQRNRAATRLAPSVVFDVSPVITEERSSQYEDVPMRGPIGIVVYLTTSNRKFNVSAKFVSRNSHEAAVNYGYVNRLRAWLLPRTPSALYTADTERGTTMLDDSPTAIPPILRLTGYSNQFYNIPVVLTNLSITYPEDVDYIETVSRNASVPIIQTVEFGLLEAHSYEALGDNVTVESTENGRTTVTREGDISSPPEFNLQKFREGNLVGY